MLSLLVHYAMNVFVGTLWDGVSAGALRNEFVAVVVVVFVCLFLLVVGCCCCCFCWWWVFLFFVFCCCLFVCFGGFTMGWCLCW